jgi:protein-L-isoaspartate O-methyltransferase
VLGDAFCWGLIQVEDRGGRVFGIERIPELVAFAKKNIERADRDLIDKHVVSVQGTNTALILWSRR